LVTGSPLVAKFSKAAEFIQEVQKPCWKRLTTAF
jgi:hypothetical protein